MNASQSIKFAPELSWKSIALSALRFVGWLGVVLILALIAQYVWGHEAVLHHLSSAKSNFYMMMGVGVGGLVYMTFWPGVLEGERFGRNHASIWTPIRMTLLMGLVIPLYQGPLGEKIGALSSFLISVLSAIG